jgi:hypothetical protein
MAVLMQVQLQAVMAQLGVTVLRVAVQHLAVLLLAALCGQR